jgi:sterol desaturase/sphingolipid hydroxylase (fatty acid hydroxylase superfamily)
LVERVIGVWEFSMKQRAFNILPPATIVALLLFWGSLPSAWVEIWWVPTLVTFVTLAFVQGLEWLHERHAGWRIDRRELLTDIFYVILFTTAIPWTVKVLADEPLLALKERLGIATPWTAELPFVAQVAIALFVVEFGQYWMHRAMHNWRPLWLVHAPHHHITQLNALKGAVGNPVELFLISLSLLAFLDLSLAAILCNFSILWAVASFAHANVRADPPLLYGFIFTTIRNHSLHHSVGFEETRCNYANTLILIDRVFGTYREGESHIVGQDARRRLSIREQLLFPVQPLLDQLKNRRRTTA